ncbi:MAG TPA: lasso RiPP family leader peptide-containing protein [Acidimicrobiales bacterium]|nr:lasso RiPP family leader peptide-containing protein [Acidimicrobiales bacterium]
MTAEDSTPTASESSDYERPTVTELGTLTELTLAKGQTGTDAGQNSAP